MTHYLHEYLLRQMFREQQQLDQQLERWGWFRQPRPLPRHAALRVRLGTSLIRLGLWLQGTAHPTTATVGSVAPNGPNS
jgi:hypothetical protein